MKKEEILEMSRKENKKKDVYEIEVDAKAGTYGCIAMLLLASTYFIYEIATGHGTNPAFYSLVAVVNFVIYGYKGIKLEKSRAINIFTSIIWGLLTVLLVLQYFKVL